MSDAATLDKPLGATSKFAQVSQNAPVDAPVPVSSDYARNRYMAVRDGWRDMRVGGTAAQIRQLTGGINGTKAELTFSFAKAGLSTTMGFFDAIRNPGKLLGWTFNLLETGMQTFNRFKQLDREKANLDMQINNLNMAVRAGIDLDNEKAPLDADGKPLQYGSLQKLLPPDMLHHIREHLPAMTEEEKTKPLPSSMFFAGPRTP